jgi:hypothetical protein
VKNGRLPERLLSRRARLDEAPGLQPIELPGDGHVDDRGEIAVRNLMAEECPKPLQLVVERGARRELDFVASRRERLDKDGLRARNSARNG